jgi:hypothetical protein
MTPKFYPRLMDDFMENYRLLHITWNDPPHFGLIRETNMCMQEWERCVITLKVMATGKPL